MSIQRQNVVVTGGEVCPYCGEFLTDKEKEQTPKKDILWECRVWRLCFKCKPEYDKVISGLDPATNPPTFTYLPIRWKTNSK